MDVSEPLLSQARDDPSRQLQPCSCVHGNAKPVDLFPVVWVFSSFWCRRQDPCFFVFCISRSLDLYSFFLSPGQYMCTEAVGSLEKLLSRPLTSRPVDFSVPCTLHGVCLFARRRCSAKKHSTVQTLCSFVCPLRY